MHDTVDVIVIGAGAAGLLCAIEAAKRGRRVLVLDSANKPGKKILMSGGGRCNFTNLHIETAAFQSHNPHFVKSALKRYTQWDFIDLVNSFQIPYHEKTLGQLFCDNKAKDIVNMLLSLCEENHVTLTLNHPIKTIKKIADNQYLVQGETKQYQCQSLVIATGGLSIPTMGASPFGYKIAEQFGLKVWPTRAGLVPFTLHVEDKERLASLAGVSVFATIHNERIHFSENILFTHRGLSGPAILQQSSYWYPGETLCINLLPQENVEELLQAAKKNRKKSNVKNFMTQYLPARLVEIFLSEQLAATSICDLSTQAIQTISAQFHQWDVLPNGTEGYRTAEVTLGGVDTHALSSKTMECLTVKGLFFIGEVVDVTGWLGGYNFQWAWSSGWAAGQVA